MDIQEMQDYINIIESKIEDIGCMTEFIPKSKVLKIQQIIQEEVEKYENMSINYEARERIKSESTKKGRCKVGFNNEELNEALKKVFEREVTKRIR